MEGRPISELASDGSFVCLDPVVPLELYTLATERAVTVRPDNDGSNLHAAGERLRFWAPGMIPRVVPRLP